jgi:hypothetical protein
MTHLLETPRLAMPVDGNIASTVTGPRGPAQAIFTRSGIRQLILGDQKRYAPSRAALMEIVTASGRSSPRSWSRSRSATACSSSVLGGGSSR